MNREVEFPVHNDVKVAIKRYPAMSRENQKNGHLPFQNGTAKNAPSCWRRKGTGAPPPRSVPPRPQMPPAPPGDSERNQSIEIEGAPPGYVYRHTPLPKAQFFNYDA
jgi:hypothetical protein